MDGLLLVVAISTYVLLRLDQNKYVITGMIIASLVIHLVFGFPRWQFIPLYGVFAWQLLMVFTSIRDRFKTLQGVGLGMLAILTAGLLYAFPIYPMPLPSGPYGVGTISTLLTSSNRIDPYSQTESLRRFKIQLWYPAEVSDAEEASLWIEDGVEIKQALAVDMGLPSFVFNHLATYQSSSYSNASLSSSQSQYPVVILSHGWSSLRTLHTDFAEELASNGYIVVGIEHTYGSLATRFSDTQIEYLNRAALPRRSETPNYLEFANKLVETYAGDITESIDYLARINEENGLFKGKINLSSISAVGHSTGGGASVKAAMDDDRITSIVGFDAWVEPISSTDLASGLEIPVLYIRSEAWQVGENNAYLLPLLEVSSQSTLYQIEGTTHYDFAMVYMFSPLSPLLNVTGELDGPTLNLKLEELLLEFLANPDSTQFIDSDWPELILIQN